MNRTPFFSVIVPCYNCAKLLQRGLESLEAQTFTNFEVIFVDDCSTDGTYSFLQDYCRHGKIDARVMSMEKNSGPGRAREVGVSAARGAYVAFMDSDDWFEIGFLETVAEVLNNIHYDIIFFDFYRNYKSGKRKHIRCTHPLSKKSSLHEYVAMAFESLWALVIKAELIKKVRMPALYNSEDAAVVPLLVSLSDEVNYIPAPLYNYLHRERSLSTSKNKCVCKGFIEAFDFLHQNMAARFALEKDFRGIHLVLYGAVFKALDAGVDKDVVKNIIVSFERKVPMWENNKYLSFLPLRKRLFLSLVKMRCFHLLRFYVVLQRVVLGMK